MRCVARIRTSRLSAVGFVLILLVADVNRVSSFQKSTPGLQTSDATCTTSRPRNCGFLPRTRTPYFRLASSSDNDSTESGTVPRKARVRFSGASATVTDPVDSVLSVLTSDVGSIALGAIGLTLLLVGRLLLDDDSSAVASEMAGQETRANLLAVFATGSVLLNGLSKLDVDSVLAETVALNGIRLEAPILASSGGSPSAVSWVMESLVTATPAESAVLLVLDKGSTTWKPKAAAGIVPARIRSADAMNDFSLPSDTPILNRFLSQTSSETYLPTLQALPGKTEFTYLPDNTQAALLIPVASEELSLVVVLGSNQARSFTPRDIAWCQTVATQLDE